MSAPQTHENLDPTIQTLVAEKLRTDQWAFAGNDPSGTMLEHAVAYAKRGLRIFPLQPKSKVPFQNSSAVKDATCNLEIVRGWWTRYPTANIGLATGQNVDVVDLDTARDGIASFDQLAGQNSYAHAGPICATGGGGKHLYFASTPGFKISKDKIGAGIETSTTGRYVVLPPSIHPNGKPYTWERGIELPLSAAPAWLIPSDGNLSGVIDPNAKPGQLPEVKSFTRAMAYLETVDRAISGSGGHAATFRAACECFRFGLTQSEAWDAMRWFNENKCSPEWSEKELRHKLKEARKQIGKDGTFGKKLDEGNYEQAYPSQFQGRDETRATAGDGESTAATIEVEPAEPPDPDPASDFKPFPVHVLPPVIRQFVVEASSAIGCDPAYIATTLLSALASAIGNTRCIMLKNSWKEPCVLWTATIAESGSMKSPAHDAAMSPIKERQSRAMSEYAYKYAQWAKDHEEFEKNHKEWKLRPATIRGIEPTETPAPTCEQLYTSDVTIEALVGLLEKTPRGILVARDELSGWLGSFGQYKGGRGGDAAQWLECHRAGSIKVDRKSLNRPTIFIPRAAVSVTGGIQPGILRKIMSPEMRISGLAARFLFSMPPRRAKVWTEADISDATQESLVKLFDELLSFQPESDPFTAQTKPAPIKLGQDAKSAWVSFYNAHNLEQATLQGDMGAAWAKLEGYAARLALVVHCVRQASGEKPFQPFEIDADSVKAGIAISGWFAGEARRVYGMLDKSDRANRTQKLIEVIRRIKGPATPRRIVQTTGIYENVRECEVDLQAMVTGGIARWETKATTKQGGRESKRIQLV